MDQLEDLKLEVIGTLYSLSRGNLVKLCDFLNIGESEYVINKSCSFVISALVRHFEREGLKELDDEGMSEMLCVRDKICELQQGNEYTSEHQTAQVVKQVTVDSEQATEQKKLQKEIDKLQLALQIGTHHRLDQLCGHGIESSRYPAR